MLPARRYPHILCLTANEKDFSLSLEMTIWEKRHPRIATFPTRGRLCVGDTAFPIQPPPLRGTSFHRKEGASTRAPSLGRGCRAQRGGVGFSFFAAKPPPLCLPHWGRGTAPAVDRVLSYIVDLRRISSLFFIPPEPYPARSARHLPHAGKALFVVILFLHICVYSH